MKKLALTTALAFAIAAPAMADTQLARTLGVDPGAFSIAELATIKGLIESGDQADRQAAEAILQAGGAGVVSTQSVADTAATRQLAAGIGGDVSGLSLADLATVRGLLESDDAGDRATAEAIISRAGSGVVSTQSVGDTAATRQLAAFLGLDASEVSLAELAVRKGAFED